MKNKIMIEYKTENNLDPKEFQDVLIKSTLGERWPIDDFDKIKLMVENANLIITVRHNKNLVGISRSITDFVYCAYLSDLAVDNEYQKEGIGKELIRRTKKEAPKAKLILYLGLKNWAETLKTFIVLESISNGEWFLFGIMEMLLKQE